MAQLKPTFTNVILKPIEEDTKTPAGLILPEDNNIDRPLVGEVVSVGPGRTNEEGVFVSMIVKKGQKVSYKKWNGSKVEFEGEMYVIIDQKELLAILS